MSASIDQPANTDGSTSTKEAKARSVVGSLEEDWTLVWLSLNDILKALINATDTLLPYEKTESGRLRETFLEIQRDTDLMRIILTEETAAKRSSRAEMSVALVTVKNITSELAVTLPTIKDITQELRETRPDLYGLLLERLVQLSVTAASQRQLLNRTFKHWWRDQTENTPTKHRSPMESTESVQEVALQQAFSASPFGIGDSDSDPFLRVVPTARSDILDFGRYYFPMRTMGKEWFLENLEDDESLDRLRSLRSRLLGLAWAGSAVCLDRVDSAAFRQENATFLDYPIRSKSFNEGLRDTLLRSRSETFSMVFIGAENAGKSTFLNAFIGIEILPSTDGPTTAYPCRIRHDPKQSIPELRLGLDYVNDRLLTIRKTNWPAVIRRMGTNKWKGQGLPAAFPFEAFRSTWYSADPTVWNRLEEFSDPNFTFPQFVTGAEAILETLRNLNHLVFLTRALSIGFDHFEPREWPSITLNSPVLNLLGAPAGIEMVDIPGIRRGLDSEITWNEWIHEAIRNANLIVSVISIPDFASFGWERLPAVISQSGNREAGAVVLTKSDTVTITEEDQEWRKQLIKAAFWPHLPDDNLDELPIFSCVSTRAPAIWRMRQFLSGGTKPDWHTLWSPSLASAAIGLYDKEDRSIYDSETVEETTQLFARVAKVTGFEDTMQGIAKRIEETRRDVISADVYGAMRQSQSISYDLRRMLAGAGKAPGDVFTPESDEERTESDRLMELMDLWNEHARTFGEEVEALAETISKGQQGQIKRRVDEALLAARSDLEAAVASSPTRSSFSEVSESAYGTSTEVSEYFKQCQEILRRTLRALDHTQAQDFNVAIQDLQSRHFEDLRSRTEHINPEVTIEWPTWQDASILDVPFDQLNEVQEKNLTYKISTGSLAFRNAQKKLLQTFTRKGDIPERLSHLRLISRVLLATASIIPFFLALPYWVFNARTSPRYRIRIKLLETALLELVSERSATIVEEMLKEARKEGIQEAQIAANTITAAFSVPDGYDAALALPLLTNEVLQQCVAANANLISWTAAMSHFAATMTRVQSSI